MAQHIKGLLFDKDGTLFDFHATWSSWTNRLITGLAKGDLNLRERLARTWGFDLPTGNFAPTSMIIAGTPDAMVAALLPHLPDWNLGSLTQHVLTTSADVALAEAVPLAPLLSSFTAKGLRIGLSTNDSEAPARAHLRAAGILRYFDFIAGSDSGFGGKPAPGMQRGFCAAVGLKPEQVAMVGDSAHDLVAGRAAGMTTIAVLTGPTPAADLRDHADVVLDDIGEIPAFLARS